ncbi:MAG: hypothetical protein HZA50_13880 [Planctomycetes bacterium]|nr:hypothetical protein [Planctomycetota bacterium]
MSLRAEDVFSPRRRRKKPELAIQKSILAHLRAMGCLVAVTDAGAAYKAGAFLGDAIPKGWPDITGLLPGGRFIGVECKSESGRQSPAQIRMACEIKLRNGIYILARGVEDVEKGIASTGTINADLEKP